MPVTSGAAFPSGPEPPIAGYLGDTSWRASFRADLRCLCPVAGRLDTIARGLFAIGRSPGATFSGDCAVCGCSLA